MKVIIRPEAEETLYEIADFIDSINTDGAGDRWIDRFVQNLYSYALPNVNLRTMRGFDLAALGLSCISFHDWTTAFIIEGDSFIVRKIIRGSFLF